MTPCRQDPTKWAARPLDPRQLHHFSLLIGRANERPERELAYWFECHIPDRQILLRRPGTDQRFTGRLGNFTRYGETLQERVNPVLDAAPKGELHGIREQMLADLDWQWDTHGLVEERKQFLANHVDPNLMKASPETLERVFRGERK